MENENLEKQTANTPGSVGSDFEFMVGKKYFFRTVTYHLTGLVKKIIGDHFAELENAAWIADSGRFMEAIQDGKFNEVEPIFSKTFVNLETCTDFIEWKHELPIKQIG